jgi:hypothetical protein
MPGPMPNTDTSRSSFSHQARELGTAAIVSVLKLVSSFSSAGWQLKRNCEGSQNMRLSQVRKSPGIIQGYYAWLYGPLILSASAIRTKSAKVRAPIFRMANLR